MHKPEFGWRFRLRRIMTREGEIGGARLRMCERELFGPRYKSNASIWIRSTYYRRKAWNKPAFHTV